jgi:hypothetical protein
MAVVSVAGERSTTGDLALDDLAAIINSTRPSSSDQGPHAAKS